MICSSCYEFAEDGATTCAACGQPLAEDVALLGRNLVSEAAVRPRGFRPTLLIWHIAAIPLVFGLWRVALGAKGSQAVGWWAVSVLGGLSLGGLAVMLQQQRRGYAPEEAFAWWVAGAGAVLVPLATEAVGLTGGNVMGALLGFSAVQWTLTLGIGIAVFRRRLSAPPRFWAQPVFSGFICVAWLLAPVLFLLQLFQPID